MRGFAHCSHRFAYSPSARVASWFLEKRRTGADFSTVLVLEIKADEADSEDDDAALSNIIASCSSFGGGFRDIAVLGNLLAMAFLGNIAQVWKFESGAFHCIRVFSSRTEGVRGVPESISSHRRLWT